MKDLNGCILTGTFIDLTLKYVLMKLAPFSNWLDLNKAPLTARWDREVHDNMQFLSQVIPKSTRRVKHHPSFTRKCYAVNLTIAIKDDERECLRKTKGDNVLQQPFWVDVTEYIVDFGPKNRHKDAEGGHYVSPNL